MKWELRLYSTLKKYKSQYIPLLIVNSNDIKNTYWYWLTEDEIKIYKKQGYWNVDFDYVLRKRYELDEKIRTWDLGLYFVLNDELGNGLKWVKL